jgi:hypothetical protein
VRPSRWINDAQGTKSAPVFTSNTGDFVFPNIATGNYSIDVAMTGFKTLKRSGIIVSAGDCVQLGTLRSRSAGSSRRSKSTPNRRSCKRKPASGRSPSRPPPFQNLPIANRSFVQLASLAPGVAGTGTNPARLGGGGANNVMMDGVSTMDTGSNAFCCR